MLPKDEVLLEIESVALSGEGVAKHDGLVFFVENALRGEQVRAEVVKAERNLIRARTLEVLRPSPDRTDPVCPHFGRCGGCVFQHLRYDKQLEEKTEALRGLFRHLGHFENVNFKPAVPSPKPFHYRNTIAVSVRNQHGIPYFGFIGRDNQSFIPIESCPIAEEPLNALIAPTREKFKQAVPEDKRRHTSQVMMRIGHGETFCTSIKVKGEPPPVLTAVVANKTFRYSGSSFFQVNFSILEPLVNTVREFLNPSKECELLDLYCGVGLFSVSLADAYAGVLGIEEGKDAIQFARQNAEANQVPNVRYQEGRTEEVLKSLPAGNARYHVVVDPPRVGMKKEAVEFLLGMANIERIVYVSCDPATLIRDLKLLESKFQIECVQPLDIFPQTRHLEAVALLLPRRDA